MDPTLQEDHTFAIVRFFASDQIAP